MMVNSLGRELPERVGDYVVKPYRRAYEPQAFIDKWNAWRYMSMLGNPRTHVRNIAGNAGFAPVVFAKDMTATAIESAVLRFGGRGESGMYYGRLYLRKPDY